MKPYKAFKRVLNLTASSSDYLFSFGYNYFDAHPFLLGPLSLPFYLLGKSAKYLIGFPLGLLCGGIAFGLTAMVNYFNNAGIEKMRNDKTLIKPSHHVIKNTLYQPPTLNIAHVDLEAKADINIELEALQEKKKVLTEKINEVVALLRQKIHELSPVCLPYEKARDRYNDLLHKKHMISHILQIKRSNVIHTCCACGSKTFSAASSICTMCHSGILFPSVTQVMKSETEINLVEQKLQKEFNNTPPLPPTEFTVKASLAAKKQEFTLLMRGVNQAANESTLLGLLKQFRGILISVHQFFTPEENFNSEHYLPKSNYAQCLSAMVMINKSAGENGLFATIPDELREKVIAHTVDQSAEQDAKKVFRNFK